MEHLSRWTEIIGGAIETVGVAVIVIGAVVSAWAYPGRLKRQGADAAYLAFRRGMARSILLGIESKLVCLRSSS